MKKKKGFWASNIGLLYILPRLVGFLLFKVYPFVSSLYRSFINYDLFNGITKIGLLNYEKIFTDEDIIRAFVVTFEYAIFDVPLKLAFAPFTAYILNFKLKGVNFFRTVYYIPSILGGSIAIAILWRAVFNTGELINTVITLFGGPRINWVAGVNSALFVIVPLHVWQSGSVMVIFLAALKGVFKDLCEATSIDGVGKWTQFFKITVPLTTPVIFYNLTTQLCQAFQELNAPSLVTKSGPNGATTLTFMLIYSNAFLHHKMGMANAQTWILFLIVMTLTVVVFISQKEWVYYSDEEGRQECMIRETKREVSTAICYTLLILVGFITIYPLIWMVGATFKTNSEISTSAWFLPKNPVFDGHSNAFKSYGGKIPLITSLINTYKIVIPKAIFIVVSATIVTYGFGRFDFKGKKIFFALLMSTLFLPQAVSNAPQYIMFNKWKWVNTYFPLIVPSLFVADTYSVFMLIQFLRGVSKELEEAAKIDGCNTLKTLWYVIIPMLKPSLVSCVLFQFMWINNDFQRPLIYIADMQEHTNSVYLRMPMDGDVGFQWNRTLAMSLISIVPSLIVLFCAQDSFIDGIAAGGIKG